MERHDIKISFNGDGWMEHLSHLLRQSHLTQQTFDAQCCLLPAIFIDIKFFVFIEISILKTMFN